MIRDSDEDTDALGEKAELLLFDSVVYVSARLVPLDADPLRIVSEVGCDEAGAGELGQRLARGTPAQSLTSSAMTSSGMSEFE